MPETARHVETIFREMPQRLDATAAGSMDAVIQYELTGDGGGQYYSHIKDGTCTITEGRIDNPSMTLTMAASDFVEMIQGRLDGMSAFMSGKLRIAGDMGLAMRMQTLFKG